MNIDASGVHDSLHKCLSLLNVRGVSVSGVSSGQSVGSHFGTRTRDFVEIIGVTIRIADPLDRIVPDGCTTFHLGYAFANFLWSITPDAPASQILEYNPSGARFLNRNDAFQCGVPERLSGTRDSLYLEALLALLERDPTSRRAILPLVRIEDLFMDPLDFPCISSFQVFQRKGKLHAVTHMRSQSAVAIMPYDIFLFTMLQEYLSLRLRLDVGEYIHMCNSMHYYADDSIRIRKLDACAQTSLPMTCMDSPEALRDGHVAAAETNIRSGFKIAKGRELSPYWLDLLDTLPGSLRRRQ